MLETLVSSRIRRSLFEHLLTHPHDRFYLRGLAKALHLSISPLRRELVRLEGSGMLKRVEEGNMVFYCVNPTSPAFLALQQAGRQAEAPSPALAPAAPAAGALSERPLAGGAAAFRRPVWLAAAGVGVVLVLILAGLVHLAVAQRRLATEAAHALSTHKADVTVVMPPPSSSGIMRGSRWQLIPGGFGGFAPGAGEPSPNAESY